MAGDALCVWVIYERPRDFPGSFVVRRQYVSAGGVQPDRVAWTAPTLDEARALLDRIAPGLTCLGRDPEDEPQIVESWV